MMDSIGLSNNIGILILIIFGFIIYILLPFLIGFFLSFFFLKRIVSNKKGKFYIKSKDTRFQVSFVIAFIIAIICVYVVYNLGTTGHLRI